MPNNLRRPPEIAPSGRCGNEKRIGPTLFVFGARQSCRGYPAGVLVQVGAGWPQPGRPALNE